MKSGLTFLSFFSLGCLLSLSLYFGCGDTEDLETATANTFNPIAGESLIPEDNTGETDNWGPLSDDDVAELMNLKIPPNWVRETKDPALRKKYHHAALFQKFGDIPQVHTIVEWGVQPRGFTTRERFIAYFEAQYFLFPNEANLRALEEARKPDASRPPPPPHEDPHFMDHLRREDPDAWAKLKRVSLIAAHGDIREVHTVVNFMRKLGLQLPRTKNECRAFLKAFVTLKQPRANFTPYEYYAILEAQHQLKINQSPASRHRLQKYREARAKGVSFHKIIWDDDDE